VRGFLILLSTIWFSFRRPGVWLELAEITHSPSTFSVSAAMLDLRSLMFAKIEPRRVLDWPGALSSFGPSVTQPQSAGLGPPKTYTVTLSSAILAESHREHTEGRGSEEKKDQGDQPSLREEVSLK
jgi:hypothetical protein